MNKKIKKYLDEIAKTEKKIADLQQYLRGVQAALKKRRLQKQRKQEKNSRIRNRKQRSTIWNFNKK